MEKLSAEHQLSSPTTDRNTEKGTPNPAPPPPQNLLASAQVVAYYFPKLVDLHNYAAANAVRQKVYNWNTLNEKVCTAQGAQAVCPQQHRYTEARVSCPCSPV